MFVILTDHQVLPSQQICQNCLLADRSGGPRWQGEKLSCGHPLKSQDHHQGTFYQCHMGFRLTNLH